MRKPTVVTATELLEEMLDETALLRRLPNLGVPEHLLREGSATEAEVRLSARSYTLPKEGK